MVKVFLLLSVLCYLAFADEPAGAAIKRPAGANIPTANGVDDKYQEGGYEHVGDYPDQGYDWDNSASSADGYGSHGSCPTVRYRNKCYYFALSDENWHTAKDYCKKIGQSLVRIRSSDEATYLASYLWEGGKRLYWTDLNDEHLEGVWTYGYKGRVGFSDWWAPGQPNENRNANCGLMHIGQDRRGRLHDEWCGEWRRYICERTTENVCRKAGYRNKCYWFSAQPSNWFNAREYCATMGMRLARVTSTDEANYLGRVMPRPSWIDLRYGGQGVGWTFADGSSSAAVNGLFGGGMGMGGGYGRARCAELRRYNQKEGRAIARDCAQMKQFICEYETLPPGSEMLSPENMPGSLHGSMHSMGMGPGGPVDMMDPSMTGGTMGMSHSMMGGPAMMQGPGMGMAIPPGNMANPGMGMGNPGMGYNGYPQYGR